jgi:ABC-2 type transport system permease protein
VTGTGRGGLTGPLLAAARFELATLRHSPGDLMALLNAPLFTVMFLAITRHAGRDDLAGYAVLAPAVITVWSMGLLVSGELIDTERANGTLEAMVATPTPLPVVVFGRVAVVTAVSLLSVGESWLVARLGFGVSVPVRHPAAGAATLLCMAVAMAGTATAMAGTFVLARSARTFQNSLSYPFYVLGGALVPVALLPGWLQPVSRAVFLSWATDLLRDCLAAPAVPHLLPRLAAVLGLGAAGYLAGFAMLARILDRVRRTGTLAHA